MSKNYKCLIVFSIMIILFSIGFVSASTANADNLTMLNDDIAVEDANIQSSSSSNVLKIEQNNSMNDEPQNYIVNQRNFKMYFDDNNNLKSEYGGKIITFNGEFKDKGVITINSDNTKITGRNTIFNNTVFNLNADGIMLTNLNFVLDKKFTSNKNAGIYITGDNCTVFNNVINYTTPVDTTGIGIYSRNNNDLKVVNNTVIFKGNALKTGFNYPIILTKSNNALILGNNITSFLPLKTVGHYSQTIYGDAGKNTVTSFAADSCNNLTLSGNNIHSSVSGSYGGYPTLSSVVLSSCRNSLIEKNNITEVDYYTKKGVDNYLYALDIYGSNNLTVVYNNIDVFTEGGKYAAGTAYPIQSSYSTNIKIAYNNLVSFSNGPNLGVYSWGGTLEIINNFINITGLAGRHEWALVAGIEVQDTNDTILNNTIITRSVNEYKSGDNLYGISYAQHYPGNHEFNIQYNNVSTAGSMAVSIDHSGGYETSNSKIMNNLLITAVGDGGDSAARFGNGGTNNIIANNSNGRTPFKEMSNDDLPSWLNNYLSRNQNYGIDLSWMNDKSNSQGGLNNGDSSGNSKNSLTFNGNSDNVVKNSISGVNVNPSKSDAKNGDLNSTNYQWGSSGANIASAPSSSGASGSGSTHQSKAYEVTKQIADFNDINYVLSILMSIIVLILLIIGYKTKNDEEAY